MQVKQNDMLAFLLVVLYKNNMLFLWITSQWMPVLQAAWPCSVEMACGRYPAGPIFG
uniref:Uncharacterized protein n=1 Tax=Arundo donax TaxID=35708 RepID=A0A0A9EL79_ARUDO